jgi:hypothetical protein
VPASGQGEGKQEGDQQINQQPLEIGVLELLAAICDFRTYRAGLSSAGVGGECRNKGLDKRAAFGAAFGAVWAGEAAGGQGQRGNFRIGTKHVFQMELLQELGGALLEAPAGKLPSGQGGGGRRPAAGEEVVCSAEYQISTRKDLNKHDSLCVLQVKPGTWYLEPGPGPSPSAQPARARRRGGRRPPASPSRRPGPPEGALAAPRPTCFFWLCFGRLYKVSMFFSSQMLLEHFYEFQESVQTIPRRLFSHYDL